MKKIIFILILLIVGISSNQHAANQASSNSHQSNNTSALDSAEAWIEAGKENEYRRITATKTLYHLGDVTYEIRAISESDTNNNNLKEFEWLQDLKGEKHLVNRKPTINKDDIEGVQIATSIYKGITKQNVSLLFKRESWDKVKQSTKQLIGKRLAIVKGKTILIAPGLASVLEREAAIGYGETDISIFIEGLIPTERPSEHDREKDIKKLE